MKPQIDTYVTPDGVRYTQYSTPNNVYIASTSRDYAALERLSRKLERERFDVIVRPCSGVYQLSAERVHK
jgi:hypothetical protein